MVNAMDAKWKQATQDRVCSLDGCRGIRAGEFYFELPDGRAIHPIGACRDTEGDYFRRSNGRDAT